MLTACTPPAFEASFVAADALDTVGTVTWSTAEPGVGWVEFGPDPAYGFRTRAETGATTEHEVVLAGLPAGSAWHWRAVTEVGGEQLASADSVVATGPAPAELAGLTPSDPLAPPMGWLAGGVLQSREAFATMFDTTGRYAWWRAIPADHTTSGARPARDGSGVYYPQFRDDRLGEGASVTYCSWDQSVVTEYPLEQGHHDVVELPGDVIAYVAMDVRDVGGVTVVGDALRELDLATGTDREIWNAWAFLGAPDPRSLDDSGYYPQGLDWTHVNTLDYVESRDAYLVSSRGLSRVWLVDRRTGRVAWSLGEGQDFELVSGSWFANQHSPELVDGGILLFDNTATGSWSRVVEYRLDEAAMTAEQRWEYRGDGDNWAPMMGDAHRLSDGSTLANWGYGGSVTRLAAGDAPLWRVDLQLGAILTFTDPVDRPGGPPR